MATMSETANNIRVYIVEDYHLVRTGLITTMSEFPDIVFVGESESAEDALTQLEEATPDILLLDLGLPGMNGIEMAQIVRQKWPALKIVILTSHNQSEEVIAALGAGAQAYALKDIKPSRLAQVIEMVHEGAFWLDPAIASIALTLVESSNIPLAAGINQKSSGTDSRDAANLTERERDVLQLIVKGMNNQDISEALHISIHTTKAHVGSILGKLCVNDRVQAAIKAINEKLV